MRAGGAARFGAGVLRCMTSLLTTALPVFFTAAAALSAGAALFAPAVLPASLEASAARLLLAARCGPEDAATGVRDGICEVSVNGSKSVSCAFRL